MKKRKPQPYPVGVVFRGHHARAGWFWADAMRATERNADAEKAGPENALAQTPWGEWRLDKAQNFFTQLFTTRGMRQRAKDDLTA